MKHLEETCARVRCRVCNRTIPTNTGYLFTKCDCKDQYIAVDGGEDYVKFSGDPDQFIYLNERGEKI